MRSVFDLLHFFPCVGLCGPQNGIGAHPHGECTWNISGMNIGYGELKAIEAFELGKSIASGEQPTTCFAAGYRVDRVCGAVAESAATKQWVKVD